MFKYFGNNRTNMRKSPLLNDHADVFSGARGRHVYVGYASSEGSGESAQNVQTRPSLRCSAIRYVQKPHKLANFENM